MTSTGPEAARPQSASGGKAEHWLLCRVGAQLCALPLQGVVETMRALPVEPIAGSPPFVVGLSLIRGAPVPVVDAGRLLGGQASQAGRLVTVAAGERLVALAVDEVLGLRTLQADAGVQLPPLLGAASDIVASVGALDAELLLFLRAVKIAPDWLVEGTGKPVAAS